jgi:L-ascorbate metabolism protein UlaG (beta-lactamase superfamily)
MQILWKGHACFVLNVSRAKQEPLRIIIDPYEESIGLKTPSLAGEFVLSTHGHYDHNNVKAIKGNPFVVTGPGEYDVQGVFVQGIPSFHDQSQGKERGTNTIYVIEAEGMRLCHMGDFGQKELTPEQEEKIGEIDILFLPVGGTYTVDPKEAASLVHQIEPKIVIPMHYALPKLKVKLASVDEFLKEMGAKKIEPQQKLTLKAKDIAAEREETEIVVMEIA